VVVVALVLRLWDLGAQSFWIDEISVTSFVRSGNVLASVRNQGGPFEPPLHYLTVLAALELPFGFETAARVPAALFGALEVGALMLVTAEVTRRRAPALVAGALLAVAPFAVRYSQENRYYTMFSALALLSWWLLLRALRRPSLGRFLAYGALAAALQLTHPFAPLMLVLQAVLVVVVVVRARPRPRATDIKRGYLGAIVVGVVLLLPWYVYGATRWIPDAADGKEYTLNDPGLFNVEVSPDLFKRAFEWLLGNSAHVTPLVVVLTVVVLAAPFVAAGRDRVVAVWTLVYVVGVIVVLVPLARALGTYFAFRRVEFLVAPLMLLAALSIVGIADRAAAHWSPGVARFLATAGPLVVVLALSLLAVHAYFGTEKTNYRELASQIERAPSETDIVIGPVPPRWREIIPSYLEWRGVDRPVRFLVTGTDPARVAAPDTPAAVWWFTGSEPRIPGLGTRALNDPEALQVIAGDRSWGQVILPWYESRSRPVDSAQFDRQRDQVATRPPFVQAPP
jgi:4-amino-4-deoxy-L-arabinose transferase-like glycosyltransferase